MRVWRVLYGYGYSSIEISTHTPVRVWLQWEHQQPCLHYFNSHTREGVTETATGVSEGVCNFNSHTREGVTFCVIVSFCNCSEHFNSHTREGVTLYIFQRAALFLISTHTPVRVWHAMYEPTRLSNENFNSHTREGVTFWVLEVKIDIRFQLTHPWGCDIYSYRRITADFNFNSHTREGVTCNRASF